MANYNKEATLRYLDEQGIQYEKMEHKAVFTMEEMDEVGISAKGGVVKNLFLRDGKGKNHFLVVVPEEKRVNLGDLSAQLNASKLSFASADRLAKYLGVVQGAVSPLGVLNDENHVSITETIRASLFRLLLSGREAPRVVNRPQPIPTENRTWVAASAKTLKLKFSGAGSR